MNMDDTLKKIALRVFGTTDGVKPKFPKTGELIQIAMEESFKAGANEVVEWVNNHCLITSKELGNEWRAKRKDWGIAV